MNTPKHHIMNKDCRAAITVILFEAVPLGLAVLFAGLALASHDWYGGSLVLRTDDASMSIYHASVWHSWVAYASLPPTSSAPPSTAAAVDMSAFSRLGNLCGGYYYSNYGDYMGFLGPTTGNGWEDSCKIAVHLHRIAALLLVACFLLYVVAAWKSMLACLQDHDNDDEETDSDEDEASAAQRGDEDAWGAAQTNELEEQRAGRLSNWLLPDFDVQQGGNGHTAVARNASREARTLTTNRALGGHSRNGTGSGGTQQRCCTKVCLTVAGTVCGALCTLLVAVAFGQHSRRYLSLHSGFVEAVVAWLMGAGAAAGMRAVAKNETKAKKKKSRGEAPSRRHTHNVHAQQQRDMPLLGVEMQMQSRSPPSDQHRRHCTNANCAATNDNPILRV